MTIKLEFYKSGVRGRGLIGTVTAESCPDVGEKISVRGKTWKIVSRSWALDYADDVRHRALRVNLNCEEVMDRNYSCKVHGYFNSTVIKGDVPCPWCERDAGKIDIGRLRRALKKIADMPAMESGLRQQAEAWRALQ